MKSSLYYLLTTSTLWYNKEIASAIARADSMEDNVLQTNTEKHRLRVVSKVANRSKHILHYLQHDVEGQQGQDNELVTVK